MRFFNGLLDRPESEKPIMIVAVGHPSEDGTVPAATKFKKEIDKILPIVEEEMQ